MNRESSKKLDVFLFLFLTFWLTLGFAFTLPAEENPPAFLWAGKLGGTKENRGRDIALDRFGNLYVTGSMDHESHQSVGTHIWHQSGGQVFLAKYNYSGKLIWLRKSSGNGINAGTALAVDDSGSIYVTGYFSGKIKVGDVKLMAKDGRNIFLAKYDADGNLIWVRQAGGEGLHQSYGIALDKTGNIYITGCIQGLSTFGSIKLNSQSNCDYCTDMFVAKYDVSGNVIWARRAGEMGENTGFGVAVDEANNVYVTGRFGGGRLGVTISFDEFKLAGTNLCNFITKYDQHGKVLWSQITAGPWSGGQNSIIADRNGHIFLAGDFNFTNDLAGVSLRETSGAGNSEIFLLKYDVSGKLLWGRQAGGKAHDHCNDVTVDSSGNVYITGTFSEGAIFGSIKVSSSQQPNGLYIARYTPSGDLTWVQSTSEGRGYAPALGIAADNTGNVFITGSFFQSLTFGSTTLEPAWGRSTDIFIARLGTNSSISLSPSR